MAMKFFIVFFLLSPLALCSEIDINVAVEWKDKKATLNIEVTNHSDKTITINDLDGNIIGCEIDLWFLGKGVKVRQKTDAVWRREQAFAGYGVKEVAPDQKLEYSYLLNKLISGIPENDKFVKLMIRDITSFQSGEGQVNIDYQIKGDLETRTARKFFEFDEK